MSNVSLNWKAAAITAKVQDEGKSVFRLDLVALRKMKELKTDDNRVIYARRNEDSIVVTSIENGEKITLETASELKNFCWGSASMPPKNEWLKQGISVNQPEQLWSYGLIAPKNGTKNFIMCLQAYLLKHLLFEKRGKAKDKRFRRYPKSGPPKAGQAPGTSWAQLLKPNEKSQVEMLVGGLADVLFRASENDEAVFCLPGAENCFEPNAQYGIDGYTEKLHLFRCKNEDDMRATIKRFLPNISQENGSGALCFLYSLLLSRNFNRLKEDLQDQAGNSLVDPMGDCTIALLNLVIFGKATPYLHNGTMRVEDENGMFCEREGISGRSDIGFLIWDKDEEKTGSYNLGSRVKTPTYPLWIVRCNDLMGVLFNPNKELMRSHNAENRFQLYYYSNAEFKKDERKETILTIDTRARLVGGRDHQDLDFDEGVEPPLESAIKTKWEGSSIEWNGIVPFVW